MWERAQQMSVTVKIPTPLRRLTKEQDVVQCDGGFLGECITRLDATFPGLTGDNHPLHYDVEYARHTRFGRPVAHGLLLASMTALGAGILAPRVQESVVAFVEQSARLLAPAFVGDTLYPELEVVELQPR